MEAIMLPTTTDTTVAAVLETVEEPKVKFTDALNVYTEEIAKHELAGKSSEQFRKWKVIPERAIRNFTEIVGDVALSDITREDALKFYRHWQGKIHPPRDSKLSPMSASSGNRQIGELRKITGSISTTSTVTRIEATRFAG
jgi:hypothetical protein